MFKLVTAVILVSLIAAWSAAGNRIEAAGLKVEHRPSQSESACLDFGDMAQGAVVAQKRGASEKSVLEIARKSSDDAQISAIAVAVTRYAMTIGAPPDVARAMVYAKCVAGDYDNLQVAAR